MPSALMPQKLYAKFPAQPKPVSAPKAPEKPEQAAKPAELKSTPARASDHHRPHVSCTTNQTKIPSRRQMPQSRCAKLSYDQALLLLTHAEPTVQGCHYISAMSFSGLPSCRRSEHG